MILDFLAVYLHVEFNPLNTIYGKVIWATDLELLGDLVMFLTKRISQRAHT